MDRANVTHIRPAPTDRRPYALAYSEAEFERLERQGAFLRDPTEDVLRRAGARHGMRVLDLGCGVGDVSLLAGDLVGPDGAVFGIDRSPEAIATASARAAAAGRHWVRFSVGDIESLCPVETFDAVIGRLVLMYLPDPAATLRQVSRCLRTGGIIVFQEMAMPLARSVPEGALYSRCRNWIVQTFDRAGFETDMGGKLFATFLEAGLPAPEMIAAARIGGGPDAFAYEYMARTLGSLLPMMERLGVASASEVGIDTLADRLRQEALEHRASVMPPPMIGAWSRMPKQLNDSESIGDE